MQRYIILTIAFYFSYIDKSCIDVVSPFACRTVCQSQKVCGIYNVHSKKSKTRCKRHRCKCSFLNSVIEMNDIFAAKDTAIKLWTNLQQRNSMSMNDHSVIVTSINFMAKISSMHLTNFDSCCSFTQKYKLLQKIDKYGYAGELHENTILP